jgi:YVTN family beta-propeller protein
VGREPRTLVIAPGGRRAFLANYRSNTVSVLDLARGQVLSEIPTHRHPIGVDLTPDGKRLYVSNFNAYDVTVYELE